MPMQLLCRTIRFCFIARVINLFIAYPAVAPINPLTNLVSNELTNLSVGIMIKIESCTD